MACAFIIHACGTPTQPAEDSTPSPVWVHLHTVVVAVRALRHAVVSPSPSPRLLWNRPTTKIAHLSLFFNIVSFVATEHIHPCSLHESLKVTSIKGVREFRSQYCRIPCCIFFGSRKIHSVLHIGYWCSWDPDHRQKPGKFNYTSIYLHIYLLPTVNTTHHPSSMNYH